MPAMAIGARLDRGVEIDVLAVGEALEHASSVGPQQLELALDLGEELGLLAARGVELGGGLLLEAGLGESAPGAAVARVLVVPLVVVVDAVPRRQVPQLVLELAREGTDRAGETLPHAVARAVGEPGEIDRREARRLVERAPLARFDLDLTALEHLAQDFGRESALLRRGPRRDATRARRGAAPFAPARGAARRGRAPARPTPRRRHRRRPRARRSSSRGASRSTRVWRQAERAGARAASRRRERRRGSADRTARRTTRPAPPWRRRWPPGSRTASIARRRTWKAAASAAGAGAGASIGPESVAVPIKLSWISASSRARSPARRSSGGRCAREAVSRAEKARRMPR